MTDNNFISMLYDSTFKALWKDKNNQEWFIKLIELITHVDLHNYQLYDPELNSGNKIKDYRLDLLFIEKGSNLDSENLFNIEMYTDYSKENSNKSHAYIFRLFGYGYNKGDNYKHKRAIQLNFYNSFCPHDKDISIIQYMLRDKSKNIELDDITIYDVYLSKYKGICYNSGNELAAMLSFMQAEIFDEMKKIASGNKEALKIVSDLEDLIMENKFIGVYNNEIIQKKMQNSARSAGYDEGRAEGQKEASENIAREMLKNSVDIDVISKCTGLSVEEIKHLSK